MAETLALVHGLEAVVKAEIDAIGSSLGFAEMSASDASSTIDAVLGIVSQLKRRSEEQGKRIRAILEKVVADDPMNKEWEDQVISEYIKAMEQMPTLVSVDLSAVDAKLSDSSGEAGKHLTEWRLKQLFRLAQRFMKARAKTQSEAQKNEEQPTGAKKIVD